jgi:two-component system CheB/CheR fusion protein
VALAADLRHNVTEFFRDGETFRRLKVDVLPQLFDLKRSDGDAVRAWCCGCGTGEEAYSVALELLEACERRELQPRLRLFATDPSEDLLQRARLGLYQPEIAEAVPRAWLERYFLRDEPGYRVRPQLRKIVTFASHEVFKDFPFSRLDLIVCRRGLLRDLKPAVRRAVVQSFHFALEPHGFLVVSPEDAFEEPRLFAASGAGGYVYRRLDAPRRPLRVPPLKPAAPTLIREEHLFERSPWPDPRLLHLSLLERYLPASVLVDADGNVVYYSANAGRYLRLPGGEVRHELLRMLREPVRGVVQSGLETAARNGTSWVSDTLTARTPGGARRIVVHVDPAGPDCPVIDAKLVVFEELGEAGAGRDGTADKTPVDFTMLLGSELDDASQRLRAMVADERRGGSESAQVEHEEFELAGIVVDLEIAKEELQTVNEELFALNRENRSRLEELARLSTDLEVLLESTGVATLFLDGELRLIRFTPPLLDIFNVLPADQGRPFLELRHRLRDQNLLDDARRVLKHLAPVDREVEGENGRWYLLRMLPYRTQPHAIAGVAISFVDITSRKRAEQRLREADRRKDEFIALLAHELRNPLAPISAGIEILKRRDLDPTVAERVTATMARQAAQLVRLIDDLLEVSRVTSGRLRLRKTPVAVPDIVRDAVAAVRPLIDRSGQQLTVLTPTQPILLDADAARLTQVLANLLNNAARYTPSGGQIGVTVRQDGQHVVIAVKDTGYGIAADALPHVFEMFYQGNDSRASPQAGLGIGLALAKSLVEMHAGTIEVTSAGVDRGSVFTLRLPALEVGASVEPMRRELAGAALGGHRILVVDDNADAAQTLAVLIRALGENEVHVAHSGAEALPLAARVKPDTVFLDLKMPEMDGYEVAQRLRSEPWGNDAWLVALTGWGLEEHKRRTKEAGFDQHLTKPADRAALESILARNNRPAV